MEFFRYFGYIEIRIIYLMLFTNLIYSETIIAEKGLKLSEIMKSPGNLLSSECFGDFGGT